MPFNNRALNAFAKDTARFIADDANVTGEENVDDCKDWKTLRQSNIFPIQEIVVYYNCFFPVRRVLSNDFQATGDSETIESYHQLVEPPTVKLNAESYYSSQAWVIGEISYESIELFGMLSMSKVNCMEFYSQVRTLMWPQTR